MIKQDQIATVVYGGAATNLVRVIWLAAEPHPLPCTAGVGVHRPVVTFDGAIVTIVVGMVILLDRVVRSRSGFRMAGAGLAGLASGLMRTLSPTGCTLVFNPPIRARIGV